MKMTTVDKALRTLEDEGVDGIMLQYAEKAARFHGHVCPGLAVGCIASRIVLERFPPSADEELVAVVENDSCSVDAIQVLTGCTFGKGNLLHRDYGKSVYTFYSRSTSQAIRLAMKNIYSAFEDDSELFQKMLSGSATEDERRRMWEIKIRNSAAILKMMPEEVFTVKEIAFQPPPFARIYRSVRCERCGEMVSEGKVVKVGGRRLCIPCAEEVRAI